MKRSGASIEFIQMILPFQKEIHPLILGGILDVTQLITNRYQIELSIDMNWSIDKVEKILKEFKSANPHVNIRWDFMYGRNIFITSNTPPLHLQLQCESTHEKYEMHCLLELQHSGHHSLSSFRPSRNKYILIFAEYIDIR